MEQENRTRCVYCGETFETEQERGQHISEEHTETSSSIAKSSRSRNKNENIVETWDDGEDSE